VRRLLLWTGADSWRAEVATVDLTDRGVSAFGTQLGADPAPYRLDYRLDASEGFITRSLHVEVSGEGWSRSLGLLHDGEGGWRCEGEQEGNPPLPPPGGDVEAVRGALDCDLALSPLTNLMPVRRYTLHQRSGRVDLLMAWVSVPDLGLQPSRQRYEHIRRDGDGGIVRFVDLGLHPGFVSELVMDRDGLVLDYPDLARRVDPRPSA
jgi:uncharacterized protein